MRSETELIRDAIKDCLREGVVKTHTIHTRDGAPQEIVSTERPLTETERADLEKLLLTLPPEGKA